MTLTENEKELLNIVRNSENPADTLVKITEILIQFLQENNLSNTQIEGSK